MPDRSEAYRTLDAAILEELILKGALGMTAEDIEAKRGIGYARAPRRRSTRSPTTATTRPRS